MRTRRRIADALLAIALVGPGLGCVSDSAAIPRLSGIPGISAAPAAPRDEPRLHLELIEKMLEQGRPYAALAHLDALDREIAERDDARLLRGETLRRLGHPDEAREVYTSLLDTDSAALAHRGLGLLAAGAGDLDTAIAELRVARDLQPINARIRNDLGYALLERRDFPAARTELVTALQLGGAGRSTRNLILLYLVTGDVASAERIASEYDVSPSAFSRLSSRAESLRTQAPADIEEERGDGT